MAGPAADLAARARDALARDGLLLVQDARLPSLATMAAGGPVEGSWWGHPSGRAVYGALEALRRDADVVDVALVAGKRTLLRRDLVPAFLAIATEGAPWQTEGLDERAHRLLAVVRRRGVVRLDEVPSLAPEGVAGDLARLLEARLLAHGGNLHTESGAHVKTLEHWDRWAQESGASPPWPDPAAARARFAEIADRWEREHGVRALFPWDARPRAASRPEPGAKPSRPAKPRRGAKAKADGAATRGAKAKAGGAATRGAKAKRGGTEKRGGTAKRPGKADRKPTAPRSRRKTGTSPARAGSARRDDRGRRRRPSAKRRAAAG